MIQEIYIIDDDETSVLVFRELFKNDTEYKFISVKSEQIDVALRNIPTIIIINEDAIDVDTVELCKKIRNDDDNSITPVIVVSSNSDKEHRIEILKESVEYYIKKPVNAQYLYYTIKNLGRLLSINRRISPLTGLPGNVQIHAELKKRISNRENFSVLYLDLDNFKAYNDVYGFLKGDEIIKYTADTIVRCVHNYIHEGAFVGHIGGDDFIAIVPILNCDEICKNIIASFDAHVTKFFTEEDVEKKLQALKAEQNGNIFYQKAMKEYGSEEAIKIALKNRLIYNFVKDDLMNQFLSVLRIDEDKLYFRAEEFAEQYDIDRLDNKEREDYLETVFMQYRDSLTNELFDLYFQVWLNEQFRNSDIKYVSDIEPLSTCKRIQLRGDSVLIDQEEDTLRNITFTEAQEVYGNFLYIPNEMEQYDSIEILGYHNVREQIKVLRIDYIDEKQKMPISISLIVSPDLEMGEEKVISENSGVNIVEYNIAQIGVKYSICSSLEVETIEEVLDRIIPYVLQ